MVAETYHIPVHTVVIHYLLTFVPTALFASMNFVCVEPG